MIAKKFDTLIVGGRVYDPVKGIDMRADIGVFEPNIAEIIDPATETDRICAQNIIDATGLLVVPGLIDMHSHFFPTLSFALNSPEDVFKDGIVATCDTGSTGYKEFPFFRKHIMDTTPMVTNAILYATSAGQNDDENEFGLPGFVDKGMLIRMLRIHQDVLLGVKVIFMKKKCESLEMLHMTREACRATGMRMFVHITNPPIPFPEYIKYFDEGDVIVHAYHGKGHTIINPETGNLYDEVWEARKRGVLFDACRGTINWSYGVAKRAFAEGFYPDLITSDMTALASIPKGCQLTTFMTELMALGIPFDKLIEQVTYTPAKYMKGVVTGIGQGLPANLTLLEIEQRKESYTDSAKEVLTVDRVIRPVATILKGKLAFSARPMSGSVKTDAYC